MEAKEIRDKFLEVLDPRLSFDFPFPPYDIQASFMEKLYATIEDKKLGIFESPTGTGKSLSIICGSLAWLKDHEEREKRELSRCINSLSESNTASGSDWLSAQAEDIKNRTVKRQLQCILDKIESRSKTVADIKKKIAKGNEETDVTKKTFKSKPVSSSITEEVNQLEKDDIEEEDVLLENVKELGEDDLLSDDDEEHSDQDEDRGVKIIFCSRTHSQLSQFVGEIKRTIYRDDIRVVPLASRKTYCINSAVKSLSSLTLMNEKCLEMQKSGKGKATKCTEDGEKLKRKKTGTSSGPCPAMINSKKLGEQISVGLYDVEDLVEAGETSNACPYYASRMAASTLAQVVVVPYQMVLHKATREASGLSIDDNVLIIDEAHNLLETITHIHSSQVTGTQLTQVYSQLTQYKDRYEKRFSAFNLMYLKQLIFIIGNLIKLLGGKPGCGPSEATSKCVDSKIYDVIDFLVTAQISHFNLFDINNFCKLSKITHKMRGFTTKYLPLVKVSPKVPPALTGIKAFLQEITNKNKALPLEEGEKYTESRQGENTEGQPILQVVAFLESLTNGCRDDGRVVMVRGSTVAKSSVKYLLLNPAPAFADIVQKARSVIVCGGTMTPMSEFRDQLFGACGVSKNRIIEFSCGHVIPPENILPVALAFGPTGKQLDFSFQNRTTFVIMNELGRILVNTCQAIPGGIVCFFPSYDYEAEVYQQLDKSGIIASISYKKKVMREPKKSNDVDKVLSEYAAIIKNCSKNTSGVTGCLLFSVVGGKLSEGLNFSDDLGRCVIVVGLPYPNIKSPELQEKMTYLDTHVGGSAGRNHYEALCMKAVNQCIGRAVRHKNDYSTVLLLDHRYQKSHIQNQLPDWIKRSLVNQDKFGPTIALLTKFFKSRSS